MRDQEFERYLGLLSGMLRLSRGQRESIAQELRDHLEERLAELKAAGVGEEEAVASALEEFGDIASLAREFTGVAGTLRRRSIMRFTVGTLGTVGVAAMFLLSFWPTAPLVREAGAQAPVTVASAAGAEVPASVDAEDAKVDEVYRELARVIEFEATEQPLSEALAVLCKKCFVTWQINKRALEAEGVDTETPITAKLNKVTGQTALTLILDPLGLTFVIDDGVLEITTKVLAEEQISTRVYAVADLTNREPARVRQPGFFYGGVTFPVSLIDVVTRVVSPQSWDSVGGRGSVQEFQGMLIVSQTESIHREMAPLLEELRRVSQQPPTRETPPIGAVGLAMIKKAPAWKITELPLQEALEHIQKDLGVDIVLDEKALQDEGVDPNTPVSLIPGQFTVKKALKMLLEPLGLTWINVRGEVLRVTMRVKAEEDLHVRLYNIRDLLTPVGAAEETDESDFDYDAVVELVTSSVSPQSWAEVGGRGSATGFRGMLVVNQCELEHERVAELLGRLRRARERQKGQVVVAPNPDELLVKVYRVDNSLLVIPPSAVVEQPAAAEGEEGAANPPAPNPQPAPKPLGDRDPAKELLVIVQQMAAPKSWHGAGGKGQIFQLHDAEGVSLVVKQTAAVHKEVRGLIRTIEREMAKLQARVSTF